MPPIPGRPDPGWQEFAAFLPFQPGPHQRIASWTLSDRYEETLNPPG